MLRGRLPLAPPSSTTSLSKQTILTRELARSANMVSLKVLRIESAFTSMKATTHLSYVGYRTEDKIETPTDRITPAADIHKDTALILNINT
jgi:hypothetical protein